MKAEIEVVAGLAGCGLIHWDIERLIKISRRLSRLDTRSCNGEGWSGRGWNDSDGETYERKVDSLISKACGIVTERLGAGHKFTVYHQSDPRGCALYLVHDNALKGMNGERHSVRQVYNRGIAIY